MNMVIDSGQRSDISDSDEQLKQPRNESLQTQQVQMQSIIHSGKKFPQKVQPKLQRGNSFDDIFETIKLKRIIIKSIGDLLVVVGLLSTKIYSKSLPLMSLISFECEQLISLSDHSQNLDEQYYSRLVKAHQSFKQNEDDIPQKSCVTPSVLINQLIRVCFQSTNICLINLKEAKEVNLWVINNVVNLSKVLGQHKISVLLLDPKRLILFLENNQIVTSPKESYESNFLQLFSSGSTTVKNIRRQTVPLDIKCSFNIDKLFQYIWKEEARDKEVKEGRIQNMLRLFSLSVDAAPQNFVSILQKNSKYLFNSHLKLTFKTEESFITFIKHGINLQFGICFSFNQQFKSQKYISFKEVQFNNKLLSAESCLKNMFIEKYKTIFLPKKTKNIQSLKSDLSPSKNDKIKQKNSQHSPQKSKSQILHYGMYSRKTISDISIDIFQRDIFYLKNLWSSGFYNFLCHIYQNWSKYSLQYQDTLKLFIKILQYKVGEHGLFINQISLYEYLYPQIKQMIQLFKQKLQLKSIFLERDEFMRAHKYDKKISEQQIIAQFIKKHLKVKQVYESLNDKLFAYYLNQKQRKKNGLGVLFIKIKQEEFDAEKTNAVIKKDGIQLSQYIYHFGFYQNGMNRYQNLLNQINQQYNINSPQKSKDQRKKQQAFLTNIAFERVVDIRCLGCAPFFYFRTNIMDDNSNQILVRTFDKVQKMKESEGVIKDQICMMLNNGGGIILFDCLRQYRNIEPVGQIITQKRKDEYQQRIYSYLDYFHPKIEVKTNVQVTFVPLISNPLRQPSNKNFSHYTGDEAYQKKNQPYFQRNYMKGLYVTRIRIVPDPTKVYFWTSKPDDSKEKELPFYCSIQKSGHRIQIKPRDMTRLFQKRFKHFYVPDNIDPIARKFMKKPSNCFNHQCLKPDAGIPTDKVQQKKQELNENSLNQKKFDYVSMLIAKKADHPIIQAKINGKKREKDCKIQVMFRKYKFKVANNTAILFHQKKFEEMMSLIHFNKQFQSNGKNALIINVTNYLLLQHRSKSNQFSSSDFKNLKNWLSVQFPQETIKLWEFTTQKSTQQYYIQTETRISTVFIYYVLNHFNQKATFKNPFHLDKLSNDELKKRMKLILPLEQIQPIQTQPIKPIEPIEPLELIATQKEKDNKNMKHQTNPTDQDDKATIPEYSMDTTISTQDSSLDHYDLQERSKSLSNSKRSTKSPFKHNQIC